MSLNDSLKRTNFQIQAVLERWRRILSVMYIVSVVGEGFAGFTCAKHLGRGEN
jgi:hypothetical protein